MPQKITELQNQLEKIIKGKKDITDKILMAVLAKGHVLLEDVPGVGKTTTALALSRLMGMEFNRIQFTPDVVPSDVTGFTMYDKQSGQFSYRAGAVMCNLLLADEINRTSSKTQSALLEVMEEGKVTVDGETHCVPSPFVVIATENPVGSSGTQLLPESQLDRFMISVSMGYPDHQSLVELLRDRQRENPLENAKTVVSRDEVLELQKEVQEIYVADQVLDYVADLAEATRKHVLITLGLSPRGTLALVRMAKAAAYMKERDYVIPKDVQDVFKDVAAHRMILDSKARYQEKSAREILSEILADRRWKDDKGQDPVALVAGLHGRSSSNYRHMAFCSGSFAHHSYFDLFCRECGFVRKKSRYQTASPKGIRENGVFPWKNVFGKSVCMAGIWRSRSAQMGKSFYR